MHFEHSNPRSVCINFDQRDFDSIAPLRRRKNLNIFLICNKLVRKTMSSETRELDLWIKISAIRYNIFCL